MKSSSVRLFRTDIEIFPRLSIHKLDICDPLDHIVAAILALESVHSLNVPAHWIDRERAKEAYKQIDFGLKYLANARRQRQNDLARKLLSDSLKDDASVFESGLWLRQHTARSTEKPRPTVPPSVDELSHVVEKELKHALSKKASALLDRPYVMKRGDKEYLVLHPGDLDPFVTVIPNDIYYNVEKKCVNWLEDCNLQGVRARLLQRIRSPYM